MGSSSVAAKAANARRTRAAWVGAEQESVRAVVMRLFLRLKVGS